MYATGLLFRTVQGPLFMVESCVASVFRRLLVLLFLMVLRCVVNWVSSMQLRRFCLFLLDVFFIDNSTVQENLKYK